MLKKTSVFSVLQSWVIGLSFCSFSVQGASWVLNNPYPESQSKAPIYYASFSEQPKSLDPARSYSSNEYVFINQIYESLLAYDYLKRPYELVPLLAAEKPSIQLLDGRGHPILEASGVQPAYTIYRVKIKKGIFYQPHPAFAKTPDGLFYYHHLSADFLEKQGINQLSDFKQMGTRELLSDDFIYQVKRLANPAIGSPIYGLMSEYILGFKEFAGTLPKPALGQGDFIDLKQYPMSGLKKIDDYTFEMILKGEYKQFIYWLSMPFFSPIPWEADLFYSQQGMEDKNITWGWYPVGTGPYMLTENNPNRTMTLAKNPNYHVAYFPSNGTNEEIKAGYMVFSGQRLPLIDKAIYTLEKEAIPRWNKFLQGYYDLSDVSSDSFDQAIHINSRGAPEISHEMAAKNIYLTQTLEPTIYYLGFNMLDDVVGGHSERARQLRQAISIAMDYDEAISIFYNGRGVPAQGPLPPGLFGYKKGKEGINPYVYEWKNNKAQRKKMSEAKELMRQAGYPNGIDPATGQPLILHYDLASTGDSQEKSMMDWTRKQLAKIGIDLNVRSTLYNRFQEKVSQGNVQIFTWGWNADYPDPENFLFLLYGPNSKVKTGGENAANYNQPEFDRLFNLMKQRSDDEVRQQLIDKMLAIVRHDAPWVWGFHPIHFTLSQQWISKIKPNTLALGTLKYRAVDVEKRYQMRVLWNQPVFWPLGVLVMLLAALVLPLIWAYFKKKQLKAARVAFR